MKSRNSLKINYESVDKTYKKPIIIQTLRKHV